MTTTSVESASLVVVDTNVLLAATDRSRERHDAATRFLSLDERGLAISPQIVREYLAVTTRPVERNGLGMSGGDAVANVEQFLGAMMILSEGSGTTAKLLALIGMRSALGKQVHDANVVAVALAHSATAIVTDNPRHFRRFASTIVIEDLADLAY